MIENVVYLSTSMKPILNFDQYDLVSNNSERYAAIEICELLEQIMFTVKGN